MAFLAMMNQLMLHFCFHSAKSGIDPSKCVELAKHVKLACPNLILSGLLTIGMKDYSSTPENFKVAFYYDVITNAPSVLG